MSVPFRIVLGEKSAQDQAPLRKAHIRRPHAACSAVFVQARRGPVSSYHPFLVQILAQKSMDSASRSLILGRLITPSPLEVCLGVGVS